MEKRYTSFFKKKKLTTLFLLLLILGSLFIFKYFSKNNNFMTEGKAIYNIEASYDFSMISNFKQGFSLKYWIPSPSPYYFPDWILDGVSYAITGFSNPQLAKNISRISFNLLLFLLIYFLSKRIIYKNKEKENIFVNFCLKIIYLSFSVFFITQGGNDLVFSSYLIPFAITLNHAGTFFNVILCFYLFLLKEDEVGKIKFFLNFLFFLLVFVASISDILFIITFSIPFILYLITEIIKTGEKKKNFWKIKDILLTGSFSFIGYSLYATIVVSKLGVGILSFGIFNFAAFLKNFSSSFTNFFKQIFKLLLFSENISSRYLFLFSFSFFCFFILFVFFSLLKKRTNFGKWGFLFFITFSAICNFLSGGLMNIRFSHEERYFLEFIMLPLVFSPIFMLQYLKKYFENEKFKKGVLIFTLLFLLLFNLNLIKNYFIVNASVSKLFENPRPQIAEIIDSYKEKYHLENGISDYWIANNISFYSKKEIFCLILDPFEGCTGNSKLINTQKVLFENSKTQEKRKYNFILVWRDPAIYPNSNLQELVDKYIEIFGPPGITFEDKKINEAWGETKILVYNHDISEEAFNYLISSTFYVYNIWTRTITKFLDKITLYPGNMEEDSGILLNQKNKTISGILISGKQNNVIFSGGISLYPGKYVLRIDDVIKGEPVISLKILSLELQKSLDSGEILLEKNISSTEKEIYFNTSKTKLNAVAMLSFNYKGKEGDSYEVKKIELERIENISFLMYFRYFSKEILVFLLSIFLLFLSWKFKN